MAFLRDTIFEGIDEKVRHDHQDYESACRFQKKTATAAPPVRGKMVRVMTLDELVEDMREYGREVCKTEKSALDFLKRAGILDASGNLAEPFRN